MTVGCHFLLPASRPPDPRAEFVEADQNYKTPLPGWAANLVGGGGGGGGCSPSLFSSLLFPSLCLTDREEGGGVSVLVIQHSLTFGGGTQNKWWSLGWNSEAEEWKEVGGHMDEGQWSLALGCEKAKVINSSICSPLTSALSRGSPELAHNASACHNIKEKRERGRMTTRCFIVFVIST